MNYNLIHFIKMQFLGFQLVNKNTAIMRLIRKSV